MKFKARLSGAVVGVVGLVYALGVTAVPAQAATTAHTKGHQANTTKHRADKALSKTSGAKPEDTNPPAGTPATVSADPLPTEQVNGVVESQVTVGNTVYAVGKFTDVRPPGSPAGSNQTAEANFVAYNLTTGQLDTGCEHNLNSTAFSVTASPDGSRVYIGGNFSQVDGKSRGHIAALDTSPNTDTCPLDNSFRPSANNQVHAIAATSSTVYFGGTFTQVQGVARGELAAATSTGSLLAWDPGANAEPLTMTMTPDDSQVIVGGRFSELAPPPVNGTYVYQTEQGMGALSATTGAVNPWVINQKVVDDGSQAAIVSLNTDGTNIYGSAYQWSGGTLEGTFSANPTGGTINWIDDCLGDTYSEYPIGQVLYAVGHSHECYAIGGYPNHYKTNGGDYHFASAFTDYPSGGVNAPTQGGYSNAGEGLPDSSLLHWYPNLTPGNFDGADQAAYSVVGNSSYVALGGEFVSTNGMQQEGLVRYAVASIAPDKIGPYPNSGLKPTVSAYGGSSVQVSWTATWDPDNANLTYTVYRDYKAIGTVNASSDFWDLQTLSFVDQSPPAGSHTYEIRAADQYNNGTASGPSSPITTPGVPTSGMVTLTQATSGLCLQSDGTVDTCDGANNSGNQVWQWNTGQTLQSNGQCLDASNGTTPGSTVTADSCAGAKSQTWSMNSKNQIVQASSGLCLDTAAGAGTATGASAELVPCTGATSWTQPHMFGQFNVSGTPYCIDGTNNTAGSSLTTYQCHGLVTDYSGNQGLVYEYNNTLQDGGFCADTPSGNTAGSNVQLAACSGSTSQQWTVNASGQFVQKASGLCMSTSSPQDGAQLALSSCTGALGFQNSKAVYQYADSGSGNCLDSGNGGYESTSCANNDYQDWTMFSDGSLMNQGLCLDVSSGTPTPVSCSGAPSQQWTYTSGNQLESTSTSQCLSGNTSALALETCSSAPEWYRFQSPLT